MSSHPWPGWPTVGRRSGRCPHLAVDAITGLSAQTLTRVDQDYRVLDHKIDFLRSPDIGGPVLRAEASVIRAGRRLALIETRIVDAGGQVYVRATSSIQMLSQQVHSG